MALAGSAKSTKPVEMALSGISGWSGPCLSCTWAIVSPPCSLMTLMPSVPSPSPPESTIPAEYSPTSRPSALRKTSTGLRCRREASVWVRMSRRFSILRTTFSGIT